MEHYARGARRVPSEDRCRRGGREKERTFFMLVRKSARHLFSTAEGLKLLFFLVLLFEVREHIFFDTGDLLGAGAELLG